MSRNSSNLSCKSGFLKNGFEYFYFMLSCSKMVRPFLIFLSVSSDCCNFWCSSLLARLECSLRISLWKIGWLTRILLRTSLSLKNLGLKSIFLTSTVFFYWDGSVFLRCLTVFLLSVVLFLFSISFLWIIIFLNMAILRRAKRGRGT